MTPMLYWQLYDACVKAMAKKMGIPEGRVKVNALRHMNKDTVHDPHKWLQGLWREHKGRKHAVNT